MRNILISLALLFVLTQSQDYVPGPDSKPQEGVPKGEVMKFTFDKSKVFPGTWREYWVYVPAQYTPDKPACVYVNQDGIQYQAPVVFDNLIHKKEMPVTVGVFVMHGRVIADNAETALDRFNRSYEYDGLGDNYARFILEEILPDVETKKTSDGRPIRLSKNGNDRAIGGSSSGAICAFTAAWERPDAFSRVFSSIGTYVGLRGGQNYPTLIRKLEPKPIRIFLQDGANDLNNYGGDWWMANQTMERALTFSGYEVNHVWGEGAHDGKHATSIFPDAMRWLWKDWPQPIKNSGTKNNTLTALLIPGEDWQLVSQGHRFTEGPGTNQKGEVFFNDVPGGKTFKVSLDGTVSEFIKDTKRADGQAFGPAGELYAAVPSIDSVIKRDASGHETVIADGFKGNDVVVGSNGNVYVTNPGVGAPDQSRVWLIKPNGEKKVVDTGLLFANGITMSPDQTLLYVDDMRSHWVYCYQIAADGSLRAKQRFDYLHVPDNADDSGADGMRVDREGRLYVATRMGIQVADQAGKVQCIIPTPNRLISNMTFGGENSDVLYVTAGDKVFKRKLKVKGAFAWAPPNKPPTPRL